MSIGYNKYTSYYYPRGRSEYYERMVFPPSVSLFSEIWRLEKNAIPMDVPVVFRGLHFGDSPKIVSQNMGEPKFVMENHGISSTTFFYKEKINSHRAIIQVHFLEEEFYCACYTFRYENGAERRGIKKILFEKYVPIAKRDAFETHNHLIDQEGNSISVFEMVNFNILYLCGNDKIKKGVASYFRSIHFLEETRKQTILKELLNKL